MRLLVTCALAACHPGAAPSPSPSAHGIEVRNGHWFDGTKFVEGTRWIVGERFTKYKPATVDVIDANGGYVVPPYGEGHNHWLEPQLVDAYIATYERDGIFYVKDQSVPSAFHDAMRPKIAASAIDYFAAHQGFSGPGGHPIDIIDQLVAFGVVPAEWGPTHGEGEALFVVASEADIDRAWPKLVATHPDFVKLFLVHSDEYAKRRDDKSLSPKQRGMDPALAKPIVDRAHKAGLRVSAHIENAHDFHVAMAAGVDEISHLPFVDADKPESYRLRKEDMRKGLVIATTIEHLSDAKPGDPRVEITRANIALLRETGATITIGTDLFRQTAATEVDRLAKLGLATNLELLTMWSIDTPASIYPDRKIGKLQSGFEASFLVLRGDPLADPANLHAIELRFKRGRKVAPAATEIPAM